MQERVRVRRERPSALSWAIALAVTMLTVYLITLGVPAGDGSAREAAARRERVTREVRFEGAAQFFADLGMYDDPTKARIAAAELVLRGAAGVVWEDGGGWHVLGAGYALEADARRIAERLTGQEGLSAGVLSLSAEGVSMRITAPEADVEAIAAADSALRVQLKQIAAMALQVDRGEISAASARMLAAVSRSELDDAGDALRNVSGAAENPVCAGLLAQLDALAAQLENIARSDLSGAPLSGALRCCHVCGLLRLMDFLNGLNA